MSTECIENFKKNLERIKVNENNKIISIKLDNISKKIKILSDTLKNNVNINIKKENTNYIHPAGHDRPIRNRTHVLFSNSLRSFW